MDIYAQHFDKIVVLVILLFNIVSTISTYFRADVAAMIVLLGLGLSRQLSAQQLFSGFSSEAVIALMAVMVIGAGLEKSGIALKVARLILKIGREKVNRINLALMFCAGILAGMLRSYGAVSLLMPIVAKISSRTNIAKAKFLMPIGFCAILGSTLTTIGSSSLIILNSLLANAQKYSGSKMLKIKPIYLLEVFPLGACLLMTGMVIFCVLFKHLVSSKQDDEGVTKGPSSYFKKIYQKGGDIFELQILPDSLLINASVGQLELCLPKSLSLLAIKDSVEIHFPPLRKLIITKNSSLAIMGDLEFVQEFCQQQLFKLMPKLNVFSEILHTARSGLCEAVVPPSSQLIGQNLAELHMKRQHQVNVLSLYRDNAVYCNEELQKLNLRSGDTLGMYCQWQMLAKFQTNPNFVLVTSSYPREEIRSGKIPYVLFCVALALILLVLGIYPIGVALLIGASGMILFGVISVDEAYGAINWQSVFTYVGLIPLGHLLQNSGTVAWFAHQIIPAGISKFAMQIGLMILSTIFGLFLTNIGATILLVPLAIEVALKVGADPRVFAILVAIAASNTFILPNSQINALIAGPGNYRAKDFFRMGLVMSLSYWVVITLVIRFWFDS